ncbi:MAG: carbohydrate binding family 9 domain-containing protein, partial [Thermoplasmata archaeon]
MALLFRLASFPLAAAEDAAPTATPSVTAVHTSSSIRLDGRLDEPAWQEAGTIHDLVQQDPHPGEPTPYRTEVQILADDENLYLGVECFDPAPNRVSVHTLQRDASMGGDDHVSFVLDTFADRRTGYVFRVNAAAARLDGLISGPDGFSDDWDGIWDARTRRTPEGWTLEVAIPT